MYTVDYFIRKFMAIPEEEWVTHIQQDELTRRCALGHCMPEEYKKFGHAVYLVNAGMTLGHENEEGIALGKIFGSVLAVAEINNGIDIDYQQQTPKQRILAALSDKKREEDKVNNVRTVYVSIDSSIMDEVKEELVLN